MRSNYNLILHNHVKKNGLSALNLRVRASGKAKYYFICEVDPKLWNSETNKIQSKTTENIIRQQKIDKALYSINQLFLECQVQGLPVQIAAIDPLFTSSSTKKLKDIVNYEISHHSNKYSHGTIVGWLSRLSVIEQFSPGIMLVDITENYVNELVTYLKKIDNTHNTIAAKIRFLKKFTNLAVSYGWIKANGIKKVSFREKQTIPIYLTPEELLTLEKHYEKFKDPALLKFLFHTFAGGLRYSDWPKVTQEHINTRQIILSMQKTGKTVYIYLTKRALKYAGAINVSFTEQYINARLKEIALAAGINKAISTKTARHSFAVLLLSNGGSIFALKELLGHTKIDTTLVYSKIVPGSLREQIKLTE